MQTPSFHDGLPRDPASAEADALTRVTDISAWMKHTTTVMPTLRRQRLDAIVFLRDERKLSLAEIARRTGMSQWRIREIMKDERAMQAYRSEKQGSTGNS